MSELLAALPEKRVIGDPPRSVSSIAGDSRRVEPGGCFVAVPGFKQDGRHFIPDAIRRGASIVVTEASRSPICRWPRCSCRRCGCRSRGSPARSTATRRGSSRSWHHRDQRQDDDLVSGRGAAAGARSRHRRDRHDPVRASATRRARPIRRRRRRWICSRCSRTCATAACAAWRWRCPPRAGTRARRGPRVRRRGVHESDAGPSRLPRHARALSARQAPAVRAARRVAEAPAHGRGQRRRSGRDVDGARARRRRAHLRARRRRARPRRRSTSRRSTASGMTVETPGGRAALTSPLIGKHNVMNLLGPRDGARAGPRAARHRRRRSRRRHRARALRAGASRPAVPRGRRLRSLPRRARARADDGAEADAPAAPRSSSAAAAIGIAASDRSWVRSRPVSVTRCGDLRQSAIGAAGGDHRRDRGRRAPGRRGPGRFATEPDRGAAIAAVLAWPRRAIRWSSPEKVMNLSDRRCRHAPVRRPRGCAGDPVGTEELGATVPPFTGPGHRASDAGAPRSRATSRVPHHGCVPSIRGRSASASSASRSAAIAWTVTRSWPTRPRRGAPAWSCTRSMTTRRNVPLVPRR